jgi:hypothetical protein
MIEVVQAFDRTSIARLDSDDAAALDRKIEAARRLFADRGAWLKPHQRIEILRNTAALMEGMRDHLGRQIAREGGKPLTDALIETDRAIDGVRTAVDELRVMGGREIPMGLTPLSVDRRAFTIGRADRYRCRDLGVQPSPQSDRRTGRAGDCRRLPGDRQAGARHAALLHRFRRPAP